MTAASTLGLAGAGRADASGPDAASYYDRHVVLEGGVAYGWKGRGSPRRMRAGLTQVGVGKDLCYGLLADGTLLRWDDRAAGDAASGSGPAATLQRGVKAFAAGDSGWFAIDAGSALWHGRDHGRAPRPVAQDVLTACIGDGADYYVTRAGLLFVHGLAHRGQYGDGLLTATPGFVSTASDVVDVKAHTGHALHLRRDGTVMGTGGNRYGPLSSHGLGDKADRWGRIFDGARAIATGSRHSAAIRVDGSLWAWGAGFAIQPRKLLDGVSTVAAGNTATIARTLDGGWWQWEDDGEPPRRLVLQR